MAIKMKPSSTAVSKRLLRSKFDSKTLRTSQLRYFSLSQRVLKDEPSSKTTKTSTKQQTQASNPSESDKSSTQISSRDDIKVATSSPSPPSRLSLNGLVTNHIATASNTPAAQRATILAAQARLGSRNSVTFGFDSLLARSLRKGQVVRFANEDEKLRGIALAQEQSDKTAMKISVRKKKDVRPQVIGFQPAPKKYRDEIVGKVVRGDYQVPLQQEAQSGKGAVSMAAQVARRLMFNETFTKKPGDGFVGMIKRLLPETSKS